MKLNPEFIEQQVGDSTILVPVGDAGVKYHGIIQLNSTAAFIVRCMKEDITEDGILAALREEYEGTDEEFIQSIRDVAAKLRECGALIE